MLPSLRLQRRARPDGLCGREAQVPGHAVEALARLPFDAPYHVAGFVLHRQHHRGLLFPALRLQLRPAGNGVSFPASTSGFSSLLTPLRAAAQLLGQVVGEDRAERRIGRHEVGGALRGPAVVAQRLALDVPPGLAHREQRRLLAERRFRRVAQHGVVVEDVEAAAERRPHQVVLAALDREVAERIVGTPPLSFVQRRHRSR